MGTLVFAITKCITNSSLRIATNSVISSTTISVECIYIDVFMFALQSNSMVRKCFFDQKHLSTFR